MIMAGLLLAGWGIYTGSQTLLWSGLALLMLPLASILVVYYGMSIVVEGIERLTPGTPVEGKLSLVLFRMNNDRKLFPPIVVELRDTPPKGLKNVGFKEVKALVFPGSQLNVNYKIIARTGKRGFGNLIVRVTDLLGLYNATVSFQPEGDRYVTSRPKVVEPEKPSISSGVWRSTAARPMEKHGLEFYSIREYMEGDDPRLIDWKATARLATLIVKEMRREVASPVIIIFTPGRRGDEGEHGKTPFEELSRLTAGLANIISSYNQLIGFIGLVEDPVLVPPLLGPKGFSGVLDGLANTPPKTSSLGNISSIVVEYMKKHVRVRPVLIIVAPEKEAEELIQALKPIVTEHAIPLLLMTHKEGKVEVAWRKPQ